MNLLTGSMTPEQFQQYQQEQQQAFFRWQQSQILNRDLDNLQQNPPSFHSESSQTLTQPQQVDSPKKGGRKKTKARRGKNVEDEPQEPVAAGRWLPVEEELLATCYVAVSEDNNVGSIYRDEHRGVAFSQEDAWAVLRFHPKWDAPEQVDLTGDVPGASQEDLFGHDARPRRPEKYRARKNEIRSQRRAPVEVARRPNSGELMEQGASSEIGMPPKGHRSSAEKRDRSTKALEELRFLDYLAQGFWDEEEQLDHEATKI
ncbi:hypothetical protein Tco_1299185 [Tanacetum coccineum]